MDEELRAIESQLERLMPSAMPDDMLSRMEQAMEKWQEAVPVEEKIIEFEPLASTAENLRHFNTWASVAALVLISVASYLIFNLGSTEESEIVASTSANSRQVNSQLIDLSAQNVIAASNPEFGTKVKRSSDDLVTYDASGRAMRVMQIEFEDIVTIRGRDGKVYKTQQPRIEYYAVPVEMY